MVSQAVAQMNLRTNEIKCSVSGDLSCCLEVLQTVALGVDQLYETPNKVKSFKSSENIQKKDGGPDCTVSSDKLSPVTLN